MIKLRITLQCQHTKLSLYTMLYLFHCNFFNVILNFIKILSFHYVSRAMYRSSMITKYTGNIYYIKRMRQIVPQKKKKKRKKKKDALNQDSYCFSCFYPKKKKKKKLLLSRGLLGLLDLLYSSSYLQTLIDSWESKLSLKTRSWKWDSRCNIKLSTIWSTSYWNLFFSKNWVRETS